MRTGNPEVRIWVILYPKGLIVIKVTPSGSPPPFGIPQVLIPADVRHFVLARAPGIAQPEAIITFLHFMVFCTFRHFEVRLQERQSRPSPATILLNDGGSGMEADRSGAHDHLGEMSMMLTQGETHSTGDPQVRLQSAKPSCS